MTNDFETKLADAIWALVEPKIDQKLEAFREENDIGSIDLDDKISDYMANSFRIDEYSYDLDGMIDAQLEYQATNGDLKSWLGEDKDDLRQTIKDVLGDITIKMDVV